MRVTSLNQNELEALRILWEWGELKPADIQGRFSWPIENATLRSVLVNLVEKGHIVRKLHGKAFFYGACAKKTTLLQNMLRTMRGFLPEVRAANWSPNWWRPGTSNPRTWN